MQNAFPHQATSSMETLLAALLRMNLQNYNVSLVTYIPENPKALSKLHLPE